MLIGGDDISNDTITLGMCFSMLVYIRTPFPFALIGGNLTAQSTVSHRGIGGGYYSNSRAVVASSPSFASLPEHPEELDRRLLGNPKSGCGRLWELFAYESFSLQSLSHSSNGFHESYCN